MRDGLGGLGSRGGATAAPGRCRRVAFPHPEDESEKGEKAGDPGEGEDRAQVEAGEEGRGGEKRADRRACVIHRAVEAVGAAALGGGHDRGQHGVAGCAAHALAEAVGEPHREHLQGRDRDGHQRAGQGRKAIAEDHERLATRGPVREPAGHELQHARQGLRAALDEAEEGGPRLEHGGEERRQQRVDHLAARVGQEADQAEGPDGPGQRRGHTGF